MAKYEVSVPKLIWLTMPVEADSEEAAIEIAVEKAPSLCAHCVGVGSGTVEPWSIDDGEWDSIGDLHESLRATAEELR